MPRPCPVCTDPELRDAVDEALDRRVPFRVLASKFGGTKDTYVRHRRHPRPPGPSDAAVALANVLTPALDWFLAQYPSTGIGLVEEALAVLGKAARKALAPARA